MLDHIGARAGGDDHRDVVLAEDVQSVAGHSTRVVPKAAIEGRLAAAGQPSRDGERHAQALQHLRNRQSNIRRQGLNNASGEQLDTLIVHSTF